MSLGVVLHKLIVFLCQHSLRTMGHPGFSFRASRNKEFVTRSTSIQRNERWKNNHIRPRGSCCFREERSCTKRKWPVSADGIGVEWVHGVRDFSDTNRADTGCHVLCISDFVAPGRNVGMFLDLVLSWTWKSRSLRWLVDRRTEGTSRIACRTTPQYALASPRPARRTPEGDSTGIIACTCLLQIFLPSS